MYYCFVWRIQPPLWNPELPGSFILVSIAWMFALSQSVSGSVFWQKRGSESLSFIMATGFHSQDFILWIQKTEKILCASWTFIKSKFPYRFRNYMPLLTLQSFVCIFMKLRITYIFKPQCCFTGKIWMQMDDFIIQNCGGIEFSDLFRQSAETRPNSPSRIIIKSSLVGK